MNKLDNYLQALPPPDESRLVGLEARVWQRIEGSKPYAYFSGLPLWLKSLPIATTLFIGGAIGANAAPTGNDLDVFSPTPAYSVSKIMVSCCAE
ncbi:MAG TPA: hypothetical protein ENK06_08490 [Gammaproteobacteria bacterium]|nr:hypothetical protein [Gammaproteobacteria bacterium]